MSAASAISRAAVVAMAGVLAAYGGSDANLSPPPSGTQSFKLRVLVEVEGIDGPRTGTVAVSFPAKWKVVDRSVDRLRLREGKRGCTYTVVVEANVVPVDATTATDAARSLVPTADGRLLEVGQRGSAAWRVLKLRNNGKQVRVDAVRTQPLRSISAQAKRPTWLATRIRAESDSGDECHSGTYRDTLGPYLGDALATLRARV